MDRSTLLDKEGNLRFQRCPFTGRRLTSVVYPQDKLKNKIGYFRIRRDSNITQIARKLIEREKYDSFNDVLQAVEIYLKGLGENYLPLARELAAIWSGVRNPPSVMLLVEHLSVKDANQWITAVESNRLEESIYKIIVSVEVFKDMGKGSRKTFLALSLYDDMGELVERCKLFDGSSYGGRELTRVFGKRDRIIMNARPDYTYHLEYMVGSNRQYVQIEGLICKIFPSSRSVSSYRMRDADGAEGLYIGSTDSHKDAHGQGSLEYDDGTRFVGKFEHGSMVDGVFYRGSHIRRTMARGKWTRGIDDVQVEKYPSNMIVYDSAGTSNRMDFEESMKNIDDMYHERSFEERTYEHGRYKEREAPSPSRSGRRSNEYDRNKYRDNFDDFSTSRQSRVTRPSSFDESYPSMDERRRKTFADDVGSASSKLGNFEVDLERPRRYVVNNERSSQPRQRSKSIDVGDVFPDMRNQKERPISPLDSYREATMFPNLRDDRVQRGLRETETSLFPDSRDDRSHFSKMNRSQGDASSNHDGRSFSARSRESKLSDRDKVSYAQTRESSNRDELRSFMAMQRNRGNVMDQEDKYAFPDERSHNSVADRSRIRRERREASFGIDDDGDDEDGVSSLLGSVQEKEAEFFDNFFPAPVAPTHKPGSRDGPTHMDFHLSPRSTLDSGGGRKSNSLGDLYEDDLTRKLSAEKDFSSESRLIFSKEVRPYILHVPKLQRKLKSGGKWIGVAQTGFLEENVKSLMISVEEYLDQNKKCNLGIALYNEIGQFVVRCNVFGNRTKSKGHYRLITDEEKIVSKARRGYFYQLQYAVNTGCIDVLQVKGWICKVFSASKSLPSATMKDREGDKGTYFGPLSVRGEPHGKGYLEYNNGCTFVGQFIQGEMIHGAYYKVDQIKATMKDRNWTNEVDQKMFHLFPPNVRAFRREVQSDDIVYEGTY